MLCSYTSLFAQNKFTVWQGFSNYWTYNHRLNRLGDFISQSSENTNKYCTITHTAATGLGKDSAYFQSNYAIVEGNDISFFAGKINFKLTGKEGNTATIIKHIKLQPEQNLQNKDNYISILNGFDITSIGDADKLQLMRINIEHPIYDKTTNTLDFTIEVSLNTDCKSLECSWFHDTFDYELEVHYLIIGGNKNDLSAQKIPYAKKISWNKDIEIQATPFQQNIAIQPYYTNGFLAYKSISIQIDHEQHYLGFENNIDSVFIDSKTNTLQYSMNLFYNNWKSNMKQSVASGKQALFAYRSAGWCIQQGELNFIQFNNGNILYQKRKGSMYWQGKNKSAFDDAAKSTQTIYYK